MGKKDKKVLARKGLLEREEQRKRFVVGGKSADTITNLYLLSRKLINQ